MSLKYFKKCLEVMQYQCEPKRELIILKNIYSELETKRVFLPVVKNRIIHLNAILAFDNFKKKIKYKNGAKYEN